MEKYCAKSHNYQAKDAAFNFPHVSSISVNKVSSVVSLAFLSVSISYLILLTTSFKDSNIAYSLSSRIFFSD